MSVPKGIGEDGHFSTAEVAEKLGVHRTTVWNWIKTGLLRSDRYGPEKTFHGVSVKELERFLGIYKIPPPKPKKKRAAKKAGASKKAAKKSAKKKSAKKSKRRAK